MKVKEKGEKVGLKFNSQKTKFMASGLITSWQIDGETMETVRGFIFLSLSLFTFMHWRRKQQPTPVFLPGESQGRGSLVGFRLWGRTESDFFTLLFHFHQEAL